MSAEATSSRLGAWGGFVKVEHTLFSLPVLFGGAILAANGAPSAATLGLIALAGIGARTLAMALNRIIDRRIDAENPRTATRELPAGRIGVPEAWAIAALGAILYGVACAYLPPLCRWLAPVPVAVFALYPFLKRFTPLAHLGVGSALALAPLGAHVAGGGTLEGIEPAAWLAVFTLLWVSGFDVVYATLDVDFDRRRGLHSLPARLGTDSALRVTAVAHSLAILALALLYWRHLDGYGAPVALVVVALLLAAESRLAADVDLAFFRINIVVGFAVLTMVLLGVAGI